MGKEFTTMARLDRFSVDDLVALSSELRDLAPEARSMEEVAGFIVDHVHRCLVDAAGRPATALVRFYKTHTFGRLPQDLQEFALGASGEDVTKDTRCLTLLATTGVRPEWHDRRASRAHQAIPLTSEAAVAALPMVSRLIGDLGLEVAQVVEPPSADLVLELHHQSYNVFHVEKALGSPWIPVQSFVEENDIRSALGFGAVLPSGDMFAVVMFTTVEVDDRTADLFKSIAPAVKAAVVKFSYSVFAT